MSLDVVFDLFVYFALQTSPNKISTLWPKTVLSKDFTKIFGQKSGSKNFKFLFLKRPKIRKSESNSI